MYRVNVDSHHFLGLSKTITGLICKISNNLHKFNQVKIEKQGGKEKLRTE